MKKFVCFVVFCLFIFCAFAGQQTHTIIVKSQVNTISLNNAAAAAATQGTTLYRLFGGLVDSETASSTEIDASEAPDISQSDITVYFRVYQTVRVKTKESIDLAISASALENMNSEAILAEDDTALITTQRPVFSYAEGYSSDWLSVTPVISNNEITLSLNYTSNTHIVEATNVAQFRGTWTHVDHLAPGTYKSDISITYTTV